MPCVRTPEERFMRTSRALPVCTTKKRPPGRCGLFFFKGKEFRLSTDNEKEKGNWLCKLFILLYIY